MRNTRKALLIGLAALALGLGATSAIGQVPPCDSITGGGFIVRPPSGAFGAAGQKGTFAVAGGCKHGQPWGHLQYHDHGIGLQVHWLTITGYLDLGDSSFPNARRICGRARTNLYGEVNFAVGVSDAGEPGSHDLFVIRLENDAKVVLYSTEGDTPVFWELGGPGPNGGGNLKIHKPNKSTAEQAPFFCAAFP